MEYTYHKDFMPSVRALYQKGGRFQRAAGQVQALMGRLQDSEVDPFVGMKLTNHGENRIKKCLKFDLTGFARLITIKNNGVTLLCFAGDHNSCDAWLGRYSGLTIVANDSNKFEVVQVSTVDGGSEGLPSGESALTEGKLFEGIELESYFDQLVEGVSRSIVRDLEGLESINSESDIYNITVEIQDGEQAAAICDVFSLLRQDRRKEALDRIKVFIGEYVAVDQISEEEIRELADGENIKKLQSNDPRFQLVFEHFVKSASYMDWMLFLHPDQQQIVDKDFSGPTKLVGVSGSGKTCIVVKRAIRLAEKYKGEKVLILTLNRELACLINDMVNAACTDDLRELIEVKPFFKLCQDLLHEFEPENDKLYDDVTWKSKEHIDEVWREYYRCELNNDNAKVLFPVHDSLIARGVNAEQYIREEFDWIRSAVPLNDRKKYLEIERNGRGYAFEKRYRRFLQEGLFFWESKMSAVGITDYLGLSTALFKYIDKITPKYRCVLIDESQDFGTIEYKLIRNLAGLNENDLFFCGDAAQQVSAKHRSFKESEINVPASRSLKIQKNYRNSREILTAAYDVLDKNLTEEMIDSGDFEIIYPEYANFSAAPPLILKANSLEEEMASALDFLTDLLADDPSKKCCIAICGYSLYQIQQFAKNLKITVLDGNIAIEDDGIYLSDLEHTKGFEFDAIVIVNSNKNILPDITKPEKEQFRDLARFYVAMTRAKNQLIVSYSSTASPFLVNADANFLKEEWATYLGKGEIATIGRPPTLDEIRHEAFPEDEVKDILNMSGPEFLHTKHAIGMSSLLIEKLRKVVSGKSVIRNRVPVEWVTLRQAKKDTKVHPRSSQAFGPEGIVQFDGLIEKLENLSPPDEVAIEAYSLKRKMLSLNNRK